MKKEIIILNQEEFKICPINRGYYINKKGQIYSNFSQKFLKWSIDKDGYPRVDLYVDGKQKHFKVHKLVWITWRGAIPTGSQINHYDDNKMNASLDNLYLGSQKENIQDCVKNEHRVGNVWSLCVYDEDCNEILTFCPAKDFILYSGHSCNSGSITKMMKKNWFKKRFKVIYYKQIENVTTMADECKPVE